MGDKPPRRRDEDATGGAGSGSDSQPTPEQEADGELSPEEQTEEALLLQTIETLMKQNARLTEKHERTRDEILEIRCHMMDRRRELEVVTERIQTNTDMRRMHEQKRDACHHSVQQSRKAIEVFSMQSCFGEDAEVDTRIEMQRISLDDASESVAADLRDSKKFCDSTPWDVVFLERERLEDERRRLEELIETTKTEIETKKMQIDEANVDAAANGSISLVDVVVEVAQLVPKVIALQKQKDRQLAAIKRRNAIRSRTNEREKANKVATAEQNGRSQLQQRSCRAPLTTDSQQERMDTTEKATSSSHGQLSTETPQRRPATPVANSPLSAPKAKRPKTSHAGSSSSNTKSVHFAPSPALCHTPEQMEPDIVPRAPENVPLSSGRGPVASLVINEPTCARDRYRYEQTVTNPTEQVQQQVAIMKPPHSIPVRKSPPNDVGITQMQALGTSFVPLTPQQQPLAGSVTPRRPMTPKPSQTPLFNKPQSVMSQKKGTPTMSSQKASNVQCSSYSTPSHKQQHRAKDNVLGLKDIEFENNSGSGPFANLIRNSSQPSTVSESDFGTAASGTTISAFLHSGGEVTDGAQLTQSLPIANDDEAATIQQNFLAMFGFGTGGDGGDLNASALTSMDSDGGDKTKISLESDGKKKKKPKFMFGLSLDDADISLDESSKDDDNTFGFGFF